MENVVGVKYVPFWFKSYPGRSVSFLVWGAEESEVNLNEREVM